MSKFNQYKTFVAVAETGSLSASSKVLHITPSAVSKQISALESALNTPLLERSNKKVSLTSAGSQFYDECVAILASVKLAEQNIKVSQNAIAGKLIVALPKSLVRSPIFSLFSQFSQAHPKVFFEFRLSDQVENLAHSDIDFAFRLGADQDTQLLKSTRMIKTNVVCCASKEYIESYGLVKTLKELSQHRFVIPVLDTVPTKMRSFFKQNRISLSSETSHIVDDIEAAYQAVKSGMGMGMFVDICVENEIREEKFLQVLPNTGFPSKWLYLIEKRRIQESEKLKQFRIFAIEHIKTLSSQ